MTGLNIGLFQFSSNISVTLVSVLFTPTLSIPICPPTFSLENVFIYLLYDVLQEMEEDKTAEMVMELMRGKDVLGADWIRGSAHAYRNARLSKGITYTQQISVTIMSPN